MPKKAERVYGKPGKTDLVGHYIDPRSGEIETVVYRLPDTKKAGKPTGDKNGGGKAAAGGRDGDDTPAPRTRPDVTQKGTAMIGDLRTDVLHQALADMPIEDDTLLGMLILAFGAGNVTVDSGSGLRGDDRQVICRGITEGGVLACRENRSQSGVFARIAGEAICASTRLPNMATEAFLSCLSRGALETVARAEGVNIAPRVVHTRERMVMRFTDGDEGETGFDNDDNDRSERDVA